MRDVSSSLMQTEDLRSSVVALDGSDRRTQQLAPMKGGWAELATAGTIFELALKLHQAIAVVRRIVESKSTSNAKDARI